MAGRPRSERAAGVSGQRSKVTSGQVVYDAERVVLA
jgi:hypothetical protein